MSATTEVTISPVPGVPKHWFLGNLPDINPSFAASSFWRLAKLYGPIYELALNAKTVLVSSHELARQIQNDDKFEKKLGQGQVPLRDLIKDGLFTSHPWEHNWFKAHRILMPVFGPLGVRRMFHQQLDIASQMILKWDRYGPDNEIVCADDFTRLAFDTIAYCSFNTRLNEFYSDHPHPFAQQMADTLLEAGRRANRSKIETALRVQAEKEWWNNIAAQQKFVDDIVAERIKNPKPEIKDLLNVMLYAKDPETGEKLDRENIRYQMVTFCIAGHETTSGTLGFLFYHLLTHPDTYHKAQAEVDRVVGTKALTVEHLAELKYIDAAVKECLRLTPPINFTGRHAKKTEIIHNEGVNYQVDPETFLLIDVHTLHRDPKVWGKDADEFNPDRMLDFDKIPEGAWKPFGVGMRSCIGRAFAEQEILINVALILQRFQVEMADPTYTLQYKATATVKPGNFNIKVRRRPGRGLLVGLSGGQQVTESHETNTNGSGTKPLLVIYGSNAGTCQGYAEEIVSNVSRYGYHGEAKTMDAAVEHLPTDRPVIIITPSYEGKPADNAKKFVSWLSTSQNPDMLKGVKYTVFGVGNSEWSATFHKVPKDVDRYMEKLGAERHLPAGFVDVSGDTLGPFEEWCEKLWHRLGAESSQSAGLTAKIEKSHTAKTLAGFDDTVATVKKNEQIADNSVGSAKMHMQVELPDGVSYQTGDYLAILPNNHRDDVKRVLSRFKLNSDDTISITDTRKEFLTSEHPFSVGELIASRVELNTPITRRQLDKLAGVTKDAGEKKAIESMAARYEDVLQKRFSIIDVLSDHPSCELEFSKYLDMLKPMTARQYSISSSMVDQHVDGHKATATITYDIHEAPARSGNNRTFHGVASTYLADSKPGDEIRCTVRPTNSGFHLPKDDKTPLIMVCSGTGLAPMRGFIEERAVLQKARGTSFAPALLYFGCRDIERDYIYKQQLEEWEKQGVVSMRPCFSKNGPAGSHKYTSDRIYAEKEEVRGLFQQGAKVLVCGSASKIAKSTADVCIKLHLEVYPEQSKEDAQKWLDGIKEDRYVSDVFG